MTSRKFVGSVLAAIGLKKPAVRIVHLIGRLPDRIVRILDLLRAIGPAEAVLVIWSLLMRRRWGNA
jgi:hypothetical protein